MRLFIGVPLPDPAMTAAGQILRRLKSSEWPVRWVGEDTFHVTLKFFGEVTSDRIDTIAEMMRFASAGTPPMPLGLTGMCTFPAGPRPRIVGLNIESSPELELLQDRLERGGDGIGFPPEGRPFHPHVTLGRVREGHRLPAGWPALLDAIGEGPAFLADRVMLYESRLAPSGPTYDTLEEIRLS